MKKVEKPNYTQIPNDLLGDIVKDNKVNPGIMAQLEGSELKVLLAVYRLTFGYHRSKRRASITTIMDMTGLSRQGVFNAAYSLEDYKLIKREQDGGVTEWEAVVNSVDQEEKEDSQISLPDQSNQLTRPVKSVDRHLRKKLENKPINGKSGDLPPDNPPVVVKPKTELFDYFTDYTGIPKPTNGEVKWWWSRIGIIYTLAGEDVPTGKRLIKQAVDKLRGDDLTISDPGSLVKTIRALAGNGGGGKVRMSAV